MESCLGWKQRIATWAAEWQQEELMLDARAMLAAAPDATSDATPQAPPAPLAAETAAPLGGVPSWHEPPVAAAVAGAGGSAAAVPSWQEGDAT